MNKFGWAYIGCGIIAHTTAKELVNTEDNEIVAVWNRTFEKAEEFAKEYGGTAYRTVEEAINAPGVKGVYIALTADKHAEYIRKCIDNGKAVLCEKPFAVNAEQAQELFDAAKEKGVYLTEAMWTWHNPVAEKVKDWINSGAVGEVKEVNVSYSLPTIRFYKSGRLLNPAQIGGAIMDVGIYAIRYCYELFGMPREIRCEGRMEKGVDLGEKVILRYDGFDAKLNISLDKMGGEFVHVKGRNGTVKVPWFHQAWKASLSGKQRDKIEDRSSHYAREFSNVAAEIRAGLTDSRKVSAQGTIDTLKIMDECRRQMNLSFPCEIERNPEALRVKTISHLGFNCKDWEASMRFYRDIMGGKVKFVLSYDDLVRDLEMQAEAEGKKPPMYVKALRHFSGKNWTAYLEWSENNFIELFDQIGASKVRIPGNHDLNYTHYSLEVSDLKAFRNEIIARGGAEYIDTAISLGVDKTWVMWMHDPDGNKFERMEYTPESFQLIGKT